MSSPEYEPTPRDLMLTADTIREKLSGRYGLKRLPLDNAFIYVGTVADDEEHLERVSERHYSITRAGDTYSLNSEDFGEFFRDLDYMFESRPFMEEPATKLFVGLGIAGTAMHEILEMNPPSVLKVRSHAQMLRDFYASHDDIEETFRGIFCEEGVEERAEMTDALTDKRAMSINGLRTRMRVLYDTPGMDEFIGIDYDELVSASREHIRAEYNRGGGIYCDVLSVVLGQDPKQGDRTFFTVVPDSVIAFACPLRSQQLQPFFSKGWAHD